MEKMKIQNCEAIIFDLDGTLYDKKSIALYSMLKQWKNLHILKQSNKIMIFLFQESYHFA